MCVNSYDDAGALGRHMKGHIKRVKKLNALSKKAKNGEDSRNVTTIVRLNKTGIECCFCYVQFTNMQNLKRHVAAQHTPNNVHNNMHMYKNRLMQIARKKLRYHLTSNVEIAPNQLDGSEDDTEADTETKAEDRSSSVSNEDSSVDLNNNYKPLISNGPINIANGMQF